MDVDGAILIENAEMPKAFQEELEGLGLDQLPSGNIVDDQGGEVRLAGDGTKGGELGCRQADHVLDGRILIGKGIEESFFRTDRNINDFTQLC